MFSRNVARIFFQKPKITSPKICDISWNVHDENEFHRKQKEGVVLFVITTIQGKLILFLFIPVYIHDVLLRIGMQNFVQKGRKKMIVRGDDGIVIVNVHKSYMSKEVKKEKGK